MLLQQPILNISRRGEKSRKRAVTRTRAMFLEPLEPRQLLTTNYALLFSGGGDVSNNHQRYYDGTREVYETLVNDCGLSEEDIFVLFADGTNPGVDQSDGDNSDMSYAANVESATHDNLRDRLADLSTALLPCDNLFFWTFDHGGGTVGDPTPTTEEYLVGWGNSIRDDELADWLDDVEDSVTLGHITNVFGQCFSGGMVQELLPLPANVFVAAAANHYEYSWGSGFVDAFTDGLQNGLRMTHDLYDFAETNDPYGPDGTGAEHPASWGANFNIFGSVNCPPVADANGPYAGFEGNTITFDASGSSDPDGGTLNYRWDFDNDGTYDTSWSITPTATHSWADDWSGTVRVQVSDGGLTDSATATVTVDNVAATIESLELSASSIIESQSIAVSGTFTDPALGVLTETFTGGALWSDGVATPVTVNSTTGTYTTTRYFTDDDPLTGTPLDGFTVAITITDDDLGSDAVTSPIVTVNNVAPVITAFQSDATFTQKAEEGDTVSIVASFFDVGVLDTHTATVHWGEQGGSAVPATIVQGSGIGTVLASHVYAAGGVYTVTLTLRDDDTGSAVSTTLAVITGAGVNNGVLYIVGSNNSDTVTVNNDAQGRYEVHADFFRDGNTRTFDPAGIEYLKVWMCEGNDRVDLYGLRTFNGSIIVRGGDGDDVITGSAGNDILLGDAGNDIIWSGLGDNMIIGGLGADKVYGSVGQDLLVSGRTAYDDNDEALLAIEAEWTSGKDYFTRIGNITAENPLAGRLNHDFYFTKGTTVFDDGDKDVVYGGQGRDWFFFDPDKDQALLMPDERGN